ncbi:MAG: PGF-pre-PGF domain-containing protein [Candidatus Nanoarchaeia archaeon]
MKRLLVFVLLLCFALNLASGYTTVCDAGCDFDNLKDAMNDINDTNSSVVINSAGDYSMDENYYKLHPEDMAININSSDVDINCNNTLIEGNNSGTGIYAEGAGINVKNCQLSHFTYGVEGGNLNHSKIVDLDIFEIESKGILFNTADNNSIINTSIDAGDNHIETASEGNNSVINSEFAREWLDARDNTVLYVKWYLDVYVNDTNGNDIEGASVNVTNTNDEIVRELSTGADGKTPRYTYNEYELTENNENHFNNYTIYASNGTDRGFNEVNLTSSKTADVLFDLEEPELNELINTTTNETANISFETNKLSNASFAYVSGNDSGKAIDEDLKKEHLFELEGLSGDSEYKYNLTLCNYNNKCGRHGPFYFETVDAVPPEIINISNSTNNSSINLSFSTNKVANYSINYGTSADSLDNQIFKSNFSQTHTPTIDNLSDDTTYMVEINACNQYNYCNLRGPFEIKTNSTLAYLSPEISFERPSESNNTLYEDWINRQISVTTNEEAVCEINSISNDVNPASTVLGSGDDGKEHTTKFNATADGQDLYTEISCEDRFSNEATKRVEFAINDTTSPGVSFSSTTISNNEYTNAEELTIDVESEEELADSPLISINGSDNESMQLEETNKYNYTIDDLDEGKYLVSVYASDQKGNEKKLTRSFYTDYTSPKLDIKVPEDDETFDDTNILDFNVSLNEPGSCEYDLFYLDQEKLEKCESDCEEDYDDCMDDADDSSEESQCEDELEGCNEDCDDYKYVAEEEEVELELFMDIDDCKDKCEDSCNTCEDICDSERSECYEEYDDTEVCKKDHSKCIDDCEYEEDKCFDKCEDMDFTYYLDVDSYFDDGEYLTKLNCADKAGNEALENLTFQIDDTTPPEIISASPNETIRKEEDYLSLTTTERAKCRYDEEDVSYGDMNNSFGIFTTKHSAKLESLENRNYTYYVLCNDTKGNMMSSPYELNFNVNLSEEKEESQDKESDKSFEEKTFEKLKANEENIFEIDSSKISAREITIVPKEEAENVTIEVEEMQKQDLVDEPENVRYSYFTISKTGISNSDLDTVDIKFRVNKSWLDENDIPGENVFISEYTDNWDEIEPLKSSEDNDFAYYQAEASSLTMFAITGKEPKEENTTKTSVDNNKSEDEENKSKDEENKSKEPEEDSPSEPIEEEERNYFLYILLFCVVVGVGTAAFFVYRSQTGHPQQDQQAAQPKQQTQNNAAADSAAASSSHENKEKPEKDREQQESSSKEEPAQQTRQMPDDEIGQYIVQAKNAGVDVAQIRENLLGAGHSVDVVQQRLEELGFDEVMEYVTESLQSGLTPEQIKKNLVTNGYSENYVAQKLQQAGQVVNTEASEDSIDSERYRTKIMEFIQSSMQSGKDKNTIKKELVEAGNEEAVVDELINEMQGSSKENDLKAYVKQCFDSGLSKYHVKKVLKNAGYNKQEIKDVFKELGK